MVLSFLLATVVYQFLARVVFHPLRNVPGPCLAGWGRWYGFYHDVIRNGNYIKHTEKMHADYKSPVIRTGPNEVHVNDPDVYKSVFRIASPFLKTQMFSTAVGLAQAIGTIIDPKKHHVRRSILGPRFAPKVIASYTPKLLGQVRLCCDIMASKARQGKPIILPRHTRSLTVDVISEFTFGRPFGLTSYSDEEPELLKDMALFTSHFHICKYIPLWRWIVVNIPEGISRQLMPGYFQLRGKATASITELIADKKAGKDVSLDDTVLDLLLQPHPKKGHVIPTVDALVDEGCAFILGGSDTTGYTMEAATYAILADPAVFSRLREELDGAAPYIRDEFDLLRVEQLPFLTAILKETLRLYTPTPAPLPRTVPPGGFEVDGHFLPGGTIISHSIYLIHHNPQLFADTKSFKPERWLGEEGKALEQYYIPFSKGTRSCIGTSLAYHEMYSFLAIMFSRFDLELFETDAEGMEWTDHMFAQRKAEVKVRLVKDRWSGDVF
ncbi:cytochrome P450 [Aspergillus varians]